MLFQHFYEVVIGAFQGLVISVLIDLNRIFQRMVRLNTPLKVLFGWPQILPSEALLTLILFFAFFIFLAQQPTVDRAVRPGPTVKLGIRPFSHYS
jgi:hypothetical protein